MAEFGSNIEITKELFPGRLVTRTVCRNTVRCEFADKRQTRCSQRYHYRGLPDNEIGLDSNDFLGRGALLDQAAIPVAPPKFEGEPSQEACLGRTDRPSTAVVVTVLWLWCVPEFCNHIDDRVVNKDGSWINACISNVDPGSKGANLTLFGFADNVHIRGCIESRAETTGMNLMDHLGDICVYGREREIEKGSFRSEL
jgi:hypothetical protein